MTEKNTDIYLFDTHCHLDMEVSAQAIDDVVSRATKAGVTRILTIGIDLPSSRQAISLATQFPGIFAAVGCHPHDAENAGDTFLQEMEQLVNQHRSHVVAYGEIGLDYAKMYAPKKSQKKIFLQQLHLAKHLNLPVIIHNRDADTDMLDILAEHAPYPVGGIIHCFTGDKNFARTALDLGLYISIPGIVTFANAEQLQKTVQWLPDDRILLETDAPFLAPHPMRGKKNEPAFLRYTAKEVARLRGMSLQSLAQQTTANACRLLECK